MTQHTLEERVLYLEQNIAALNEATTDTANAIKQLLTANQTKSADLQLVLDQVLAIVCPFPPGCD